MLKEDIMTGYLIFELKDGRKVAGRVETIDYKGGCVLKDVIIELPADNVSPINQYIEYRYDSSKDFKSRLAYFFDVPEGNNIDELEKRCYCTNGLILTRSAIARVLQVNKS